MVMPSSSRARKSASSLPRSADADTVVSHRAQISAALRCRMGIDRRILSVRSAAQGAMRVSMATTAEASSREDSSACVSANRAGASDCCHLLLINSSLSPSLPTYTTACLPLSMPRRPSMAVRCRRK